MRDPGVISTMDGPATGARPSAWSWIATGLQRALGPPRREDLLLASAALLLGVGAELTWATDAGSWSASRAALFAATAAGALRLLYHVWTAPSADHDRRMGELRRAHHRSLQERARVITERDRLRAQRDRARDERDRARQERDRARQEREEALTALGSLRRERPRVDALPLAAEELAIRALPLSTDAPRTLALRRIHLVNRGQGTFLREWRIVGPIAGIDGQAEVRVLSRTEWEPLASAGDDGSVPVICREDLLPAPRNRPLRLDLPFMVEGCFPEELAALVDCARVEFTDGCRSVWSYGGSGPRPDG